MYKTPLFIISNSNRNVCFPFAFRCLSYTGYKKRVGTCNYKILGLLPSASQTEIKQAYYDKSKQYHPDINSSTDAALKFQEVNLAYEILSNENLRADYDYDNGHSSPRMSSTRNNNPQYSGEQMDEGDKFDNEFANSVFRNRKILNRMKNSNYNFKEGFHFETQQTSSYSNWKRKEGDFFENLSPEMKANYQDYLDKIDEQRKEAEEELKNTRANSNAILVVVLSFGIIFVIMEICGSILGISDTKKSTSPPAS